MKHNLLTAAGLAVTFAAASAFATPSIAQRTAAPATAKPAAKTPTRADIIRSADATFAKVDTNGDKSLNKAEVDAAEARRAQQASQNVQSRISQEFTKLDTDKNGSLSLAEFRAAAPTVKINPNASQQAISRLDTNQDGKIGADEYRAPMLAAFDRADTNKDGTLSADERSKAAKARQQTASRK